jgi:hypothetical protein
MNHKYPETTNDNNSQISKKRKTSGLKITEGGTKYWSRKLEEWTAWTLTSDTAGLTAGLQQGRCGRELWQSNCSTASCRDRIVLPPTPGLLLTNNRTEISRVTTRWANQKAAFWSRDMYRPMGEQHRGGYVVRGMKGGFIRVRQSEVLNNDVR